MILGFALIILTTTLVRLLFGHIRSVRTLSTQVYFVTIKAAAMASADFLAKTFSILPSRVDRAAVQAEVDRY
jgi:hypothetical protein